MSYREEFELFYRENFERVLRAARFLGTEDDAFDLAQESFARTWAAWDRARQRQSPRAYVLKTLSHLAASRFRSSRRVKRFADSQAPSQHVDVDPYREVDLRVVFEATLQALPVQQRRALVLCDIADLPADEAATLLGIRPSTMRVHLARARVKVRASIEAKHNSPSLGDIQTPKGGVQ